MLEMRKVRKLSRPYSNRLKNLEKWHKLTFWKNMMNMCRKIKFRPYRRQKYIANYCRFRDKRNKGKSKASVAGAGRIPKGNISRRNPWGQRPSWASRLFQRGFRRKNLREYLGPWSRCRNWISAKSAAERLQPGTYLRSAQISQQSKSLKQWANRAKIPRSIYGNTGPWGHQTPVDPCFLRERAVLDATDRWLRWWPSGIQGTRRGRVAAAKTYRRCNRSNPSKAWGTISWRQLQPRNLKIGSIAQIDSQKVINFIMRIWKVWRSTKVI